MPRVNPTRWTDPRRGTRTLREAAALLGCGPRAVIEMINSGALPAVSFGNRQQPTVAGLERMLGKSLSEFEATPGRKVDLRPADDSSDAGPHSSSHSRRRLGEHSST